MQVTLTLVVPFFGLILIGYAVGKLLALPRESTSAVDGLVRYVALPVLFFSLIAETPTEQLAGLPFLVTTAFSTYCAFAIAFSIGALLNRGNVAEATIQGLSGSWSNTALLAPGLTIALFGPMAAAPDRVRVLPRCDRPDRRDAGDDGSRRGAIIADRRRW